MPTVTYTAQRSLVTSTSPVHAVGTEYSLALSLADINLTPKNIGKIMSSLGGNREAISHRIEESYQLATPPLTVAQQEFMLEFLDSVVDGTTFTFDPEGSLGSPVATLSCKLKGYTPSKVEISWCKYTFDLVVL